MKNTKVVAVLSFFFILFFNLIPFSFSEDKDLYLEGISYDADPNQSIAVINGNFLKKGGEYDGYKILEIKPSFVKLEKADGSGGERELRITGGPTKIQPPVPAAAPAQTPSVPTERIQMPQMPTGGTASPDSLQGQVQKMFADAMTNPAAIMGKAREVGVLANVRQVYTAAAAASSEEGPGQISIDQLADRGMISPAYKGGVKDGYRYTVKSGNNGATVSADPVDASSGTKHFFIDEWGDLHAQDGSPATIKSPKYQI